MGLCVRVGARLGKIALRATCLQGCNVVFSLRQRPVETVAQTLRYTVRGYDPRLPLKPAGGHPRRASETPKIAHLCKQHCTKRAKTAQKHVKVLYQEHTIQREADSSHLLVSYMQLLQIRSPHHPHNYEGVEAPVLLPIADSRITALLLLLLTGAQNHRLAKIICAFRATKQATIYCSIYRAASRESCLKHFPPQ